ncbi:MAG: BlaI/MecI/CopY family transcriptional regulator [Candidatus Bipolaricaulia bacterium]
MTRPRSPILTEGELRLMNILWDKGAATVREVANALPEDQSLAYTTVLTTLQTLEKKGFLRHEKQDQDRAFIYHPVVDRNEARRSAVRYIVSRFFNGSPELLVLNILEHEELDSQELQYLKQLLEEEEEVKR